MLRTFRTAAYRYVISLIVRAGAIALLANQTTLHGEEARPPQASRHARAPEADVANLLSAVEAVDPHFAAELRRQIADGVANAPRREAAAIAAVLDHHCLLIVAISPESRVKVDPGAADRELTPGEWRTYLVRVENHARVSSPLAATSPQFDDGSPADRAAGQRWLEFEMIDRPPLAPTLAGNEVEYRPARLRTRATGKRAAVIAMDVGQGTADIGFRNDVMLTFASRAINRGDVARQFAPSPNISPTLPEANVQSCPPVAQGVDSLLPPSSSLLAENVSLAADQAPETETELRGLVLDASDDRPLPARITIQGEDGQWRLAESVDGQAVHYRKLKSDLPHSPEVHATLSAGPFVVGLRPGKYAIRVERGKEYLPAEEELIVGSQPLEREYRLRRWINMADRGWYSGDVHVHRSLKELPNVIMAEDLNVALPVSYWAVDAAAAPSAVETFAAVPASSLIEVDPTHVIYPLNTEYEIFHIAGRQTALGALLVLNHRKPFDLAAPPLERVAAAARRQGALLDLEKHSWPWSLMLVPVADVDLFELANNHVWQTPFGLKQWTLNTAPSFMEIEQDAEGFTERGWIDFGFQTYYALVNCGFRLRVSAGTASGVHPTPLGFGRVYVYCPEGFSYDHWMEGLDAGRSFVSTGPMLDVRFNDQPPGAAFALSQHEQASMRISGTAESAVPLDRIEVVVNGRVEQSIKPVNQPTAVGGYRSPIDLTISRDGSFWAAVRCFEKRPADRVRFAHTNPSYVDVEGRPLAPRRAEVEYFIRRLEEEIENYREMLSADALREFEQALDAYRKLTASAR